MSFELASLFSEDDEVQENINTETFMNLPDLPQDILDEIFSYINVWHLFTLMTVSKSWKRMLENSIKTVNCVNRTVKLSFLLRLCALPRLSLVRFTSSPPELNALSQLTTLHGLMISDFKANMCRIALESNQNNDENNTDDKLNESFEAMMQNAAQISYVTSLVHFSHLTRLYPFATLPVLATNIIPSITELRRLTRLYLAHEIVLMNVRPSHFEFLQKVTMLHRLELQIALSNEFLEQLTQLQSLRFLWLVDTSPKSDTSLLTFPCFSNLTTIELSTHRHLLLSDFVKQIRLQNIKFHQTLNLKQWERFPLMTNLVSLKLVLGTELDLQTQLRYLAELTNLTRLEFKTHRCTNTEIEFLKHMTKLKNLSISDFTADLWHLMTFSSLQYLTILGLKENVGDIQLLYGMTQLKGLHAHSKTNRWLIALDTISRMTQLNRLHLGIITPLSCSLHLTQLRLLSNLTKLFIAYPKTIFNYAHLNSSFNISSLMALTFKYVTISKRTLRAICELPSLQFLTFISTRWDKEKTKKEITSLINLKDLIYLKFKFIFPFEEVKILRKMGAQFMIIFIGTPEQKKLKFLW